MLLSNDGDSRAYSLVTSYYVRTRFHLPLLTMGSKKGLESTHSIQWAEQWEDSFWPYLFPCLRFIWNAVKSSYTVGVGPSVFGNVWSIWPWYIKKAFPVATTTSIYQSVRTFRIIGLEICSYRSSTEISLHFFFLSQCYRELLSLLYTNR